MMYEIEVKCGHVGRSNYILKTVPVQAENGKAAAAKARMMPRVKHDHPDAVRQVRVVDAPRYAELVRVHKADPYFQCHSIQEQRNLCPGMELFREDRKNKPEKSQYSNLKKPVYVGKELIRNPKKYLKYYEVSEEIAA